MIKVIFISLFLLSCLSVSAQCKYHTDTLNQWIVVLTKASQYKKVEVIKCKEVQQFDEFCKGNIIGYLDLFKQPLFMDNYYILFKSTTKIRL